MIYVYAISNQTLACEVDGIDGAAVEWLHGPLVAAVSHLALDAAQPHDLTWLEPRAMAHQAVNAYLAERLEALIPLAFGSLYRESEHVQRLLADHTLPGLLDKLRGRREWVLTVELDEMPEPAVVREMKEQIATSAPGRAHLLRLRLAQVEQDARLAAEAKAAAQVRAGLLPICDDLYQEPVEGVWRASLLVAREREAALVEHVEGLRMAGHRVDLTGAWPAYRFASLEHNILV